jgi:hypothetical protein
MIYVIKYEQIDTETRQINSIFSNLESAKKRLVENYKEDPDFKYKFYEIEEYKLENEEFIYTGKSYRLTKKELTNDIDFELI